MLDKKLNTYITYNIKIMPVFISPLIDLRPNLHIINMDMFTKVLIYYLMSLS